VPAECTGTGGYVFRDDQKALAENGGGKEYDVVEGLNRNPGSKDQDGRGKNQVGEWVNGKKIR